MKVFQEDWLKDLQRKYHSASKYTTPFIAKLALDPTYASERDKIERWFEILPEDAKPEMLGGLRNGNSSQHFGAYHELVLFHFFKSMGYSVDIHPKLGDVTPDLLITGKNLDKPIVVEVATVFDEPYWEKEEKKFNLILERLSKLEHYFGIDVSVVSEHIPQKVHYNKLERHVKEQLDSIYSQIFPGDYGFQYEEDGLHLQLRAFPNLQKSSILWSHGLPARFIGAEQLRKMITRKVNRYKIVKERALHFVIALNVTNMPAGETGLLRELFGKPGIRITRDKNGHAVETKEHRDFSGLFTPKPGLGAVPENSRLSGVLNVESKWLDTEEDAQIRRVHYFRMIHNEWASNPISHEVFGGYPQFVKISENETTTDFGWIGDCDDKPFDC